MEIDFDTIKQVLKTLPLEIDGQPVDLETFWRTQIAREVFYLAGIFVLSKALNIKFRKAWGIAAAYNLLRSSNTFVSKTRDPFTLDDMIGEETNLSWKDIMPSGM